MLQDPRLLLPLSDLALDDQEAGTARSGVRRPYLLTSKWHRQCGEAVKKVPGVTNFNNSVPAPIFQLLGCHKEESYIPPHHYGSSMLIHCSRPLWSWCYHDLVLILPLGPLVTQNSSLARSSLGCCVLSKPGLCLRLVYLVSLLGTGGSEEDLPLPSAP